MSEIFVYSFDPFFFFSHSDFAEHLSRQLTEKLFNQVQPGSAFRTKAKPNYSAITVRYSRVFIDV